MGKPDGCSSSTWRSSVTLFELLTVVVAVVGLILRGIVVFQNAYYEKPVVRKKYRRSKKKAAEEREVEEEK